MGEISDIGEISDQMIAGSESVSRRQRTFWKILTVSIFVPMFASFLISFSMYWWPSIPSTPHPAEGLVYPLNNHGTYTYMNRNEYLLSHAMWWIYLVGMPALAAIEHFVDPFDHKRRWREVRPPRPW
jgi:hypothetical protein